MNTNIVKLHPIPADKGKGFFEGDVTIIELDSTPNFVKYLINFEDGKIIYAQCDNGTFTYKANFVPEHD
ncbi:hypothetical protein RSA37_11680 [Mammaliicoccus sciuri]|uniref:hypothetical protein n=1 Tax=Mammaliicoccus sciuri TaxID=1296 RepID=UPI000734B208|nr:hypothetical protein [Mammaliicoccus sciuri]KTT82693.1 hypothetical protein NS1R_11940 [Mammaliicoccus sciuri]KTT88250.1 hypothetical protein NS112_09550 [Mammaliicoccus sciuri]KTT89793.1 hypothetical protein NS36R_08075 [Mammaliicoccus sciuri]KTT94185.1 hypothetical protein NS44R_08490 [Mammaliicoccus sciuri]KTW10709.1 hypothetical protein RSA37_11680 [Mammaliicoccus sciuri]